jgi:hypothetical protein
MGFWFCDVFVESVYVGVGVVVPAANELSVQSAQGAPELSMKF